MLTKRLETTLSSITRYEIGEKNLWSLVDLTLLNESATSSQLHELTIKAQNHHVAAICVFPQHLSAFSKIKRATVANFPSGSMPQEEVLQTIEESITQHQADEIDYVFAYETYLSGEKDRALSLCLEAYQLCQHHQRTFKVILETGAFPSLDAIYHASQSIIQQGCDFLKTSTGKIATGATIPAAFAILAAITDVQSNCGIKVSGGIRTFAKAREFIELATHMRQLEIDKKWFRIGSSGLSDHG